MMVEKKKISKGKERDENASGVVSIDSQY